MLRVWGEYHRPHVTSPDQNPFAALTFIAAPAVLTNAASVLALSTSNRFLRASERMRALYADLNAAAEKRDSVEQEWMIRQVNRVETQAVWLLSALRGAYVALGSFASASLIAILGTAVSSSELLQKFHYPIILLGLIVGFIGAGGLVWGCTRLFRATRISMQNIVEEAAMMRERHKSFGSL